MKDLIAKLEAASEGSRELDIAIAKQCFPEMQACEVDDPITGRETAYYLHGIHMRIGCYSQSIDAAMTLAWAVKGPDGINLGTTGLHDFDSRARFLALTRRRELWPFWEGQGYRLVRVRITEVSDER